MPSFLASSALGNLGLLDAITGEDRGPSSMKQWMVRLKSQSMVKQRERVHCVIAEVFPTHNFPYLKLLGRPMKNKSLDTQKYELYKVFCSHRVCFPISWSSFKDFHEMTLSQNEL